jgi:hypothetical protein
MTKPGAGKMLVHTAGNWFVFLSRLRIAVLALLCAAGLLSPALAVAQKQSKRKAPPGAGVAAPYEDEKEPCPGKRQKTAEATYRHYDVRIYRTPNTFGCVEILRDRRRVFTQNGFQYYLGGGASAADESSSRVKMGTDITGEGQPNLVLGEWSGGAHCCLKLQVFEIGEKFRKVAELDLQHTADPEFADVDGDGRIELVVADWTFAYWHAPFADSPAPQVILRFRDGAFHLATELMRKTPPRDADLTSKARQIRENPDWTENSDPPAGLWGEMLDLVYGGNAQLAWSFLDVAWPPARPGKEKFLQEFREQLAKSPYWSDLQELSGTPAK